MVIAWSGSIVSIPTGWALDTNARDKMIIGAGNLYNVDATGGEATHTLTESEMPDHTHIQNSHSHSISGADSGGGAKLPRLDALSSFTRDTNGTVATNQNTGGGAAHNNLPPYIAYAYIKKS